MLTGYDACTLVVHVGFAMYKYGIELWTKTDLSPVNLDELKESTFCLLMTLKRLQECSFKQPESWEVWSGSPENHLVVENSAIWPEMYSIWAYAEQGLYSNPFTDPDAYFADLSMWISAVLGVNAYEGEFIGAAIIKVIIKFWARLKLDFDLDLDSNEINTPFGDVMAVRANWFPQIAMKNLTVLEIALLSGVSNIRSVRNAQYDKGNPLNFFKDGKQVLITVADARVWLSDRKGFIASTQINLNTGVTH
jgi:hypothetical protein